MNFPKHTEFVRLTDNEPLTVVCSALADFLWEDFVREARPNVTYLIDHYNIKKLSRFGKEVFERLYNADDVTWVVSNDNIEEHFRAVQNGDTTEFPRGYKPENAIWYVTMGFLSSAPTWPDLVSRSYGNQFNAGNNAVNILNKISDLLENLIENQELDTQLVFGSAEKLEKLRERFQEAQAQNDQATMQKIRAEARELKQLIEEAVMKLGSKLEPKVSEAVDQANRESEQLEDMMSKFFGDSNGTGSHAGDLAKKRELAKRLDGNRQLKLLAKRLGALRMIWQQRKRAKVTKSKYEAISGAVFSNDITRAYPVDLALAASDKGRALFALKFSQKTLLTKDYDSHCKNIGKGPIIIYVDSSGSMNGENEVWSKAITIVIAEEAAKENREVQIYLFDSQIGQGVTLKDNKKLNTELLDFVTTWRLGGGTSFNNVIRHAIDEAEKHQRSDILMITDGHSEVQDFNLRKLGLAKQRTGLVWSTICIGTDVPSIVSKFSDDSYAVDISAEASTIDVIQKCLH